MPYTEAAPPAASDETGTARPCEYAGLLIGSALGVAITLFFLDTPPAADGATFFECGKRAWSLPLAWQNFHCGVHDFSYFSMALFGLSHSTPLPPLVALRMIQLLHYVLAVGAFYSLTRFAAPNAARSERGLVTLLFAVTPVVLAYMVGVALDFFLLTWFLLYVKLLLERRFLPAALCATAMAFSKETGLLIFGVSLPFVLLIFGRGSGGFRRTVHRLWPLLLPLTIYAVLVALRHRDLVRSATDSQLCGASLSQILFRLNLERSETQRYLFNVLVLNFQWVLLIPVAIFAARWLFERAFRASRSDMATHEPILVYLLFLLAWIYVFTRCPIFNNCKYIMMALPMYLLLIFWLSRRAIPGLGTRLFFFSGCALLFTISAFRTVDPLSMAYYGTTTFRSRTILCKEGQPVRPEACAKWKPHGIKYNDETIYNLQHFFQEKPR